MSAHTPGPWRVVVSNAGATCDVEAGGGELLAKCFMPFPFDTSLAERDANARLIAAAPDLLEALHRLCELNAADRPIAKTWGRAAAVIAKATGSAA